MQLHQSGYITAQPSSRDNVLPSDDLAHVFKNLSSQRGGGALPCNTASHSGQRSLVSMPARSTDHNNNNNNYPPQYQKQYQDPVNSFEEDSNCEDDDDDDDEDSCCFDEKKPMEPSMMSRLIESRQE
jgi:hypothetical protein